MNSHNQQAAQGPKTHQAHAIAKTETTIDETSHYDPTEPDLEMPQHFDDIISYIEAKGDEISIAN